MSLAAMIRRMAEAGAPAEAIAIAVEAIEERDTAETERKAKRAEQKRRERDRRATVARHDGDCRATVAAEPPPSPPSASPPMINNSTPPSPPSTSPTKSAPAQAFARFWSAWPNRVGKPAAERAFAKVAGEIEAILDGVGRYVADKPADRPWLNPATFLNQRRWEDAPAPAPMAGQARAGPQRGNSYLLALMDASEQIANEQSSLDEFPALDLTPS